MKKKIALITGVTGQDGSYLAEFLLKKNYIVHGIKRRSSLINTQRLDHLYIDPHNKTNFFLHYGDVLDANNLIELIKKIKPNEVYNLAAQSHVLTSFSTPDYTTQVNALGTLRILEAIRVLGLTSRTKFYQASSSEIFGNSKKKKQSEKTSFNPESPYASSKLYAYWITKNYRDAYGLFASNGILFNHESPRRGETFVTRKITIGLNKIALGIEKKLYLGNLYSYRDWGHAKDYAEMQWKILQQNKSDDYVIATGQTYSVKFFVEKCCKFLDLTIHWSGKGMNECGYVKDYNSKKCPALKKGYKIIEIDKNYFRPNEVNNLRGESKKAKNKLGWKPKTTILELIREMMTEDNKLAKKMLKNEI
jgi:GDPmannose 4,6-dehydratase